MRPDFLRILKLSAACALTACPSPAPSPPGQDAGTPPPPELARSSRNNLRFKGPERLSSDFAAALSLPVEQVCNELGQYPCTSSVHNVALGGVEPYGMSIYEPLPFTGTTTPIAVDRVALSACGQRVTLDVTTPSEAVIFVGINLDAQGRLASGEGEPVKNAITSLYQRALLRDPTETEVGALLQLATDIEASGSQAPGRDWMKATCFVVLSSAESIFF
ncbi:hypothetical protein D187_008918 [Cystobacter fuscus DSM 2262]|uniref:Lipoprotein n=1 Tax=Cystobacter fuscus (strain ATCC 25194 / DSM 2262 / NBRC 100088 / M29) TaxID=1242864 RepID=S9PED0_CYSF2|nr:hypothetical protein [Cystobacter fuscus]EPX62730.1 hypothetical protein D187_008918 [Cystobacter fuscus DSM 2262]